MMRFDGWRLASVSKATRSNIFSAITTFNVPQAAFASTKFKAQIRHAHHLTIRLEVTNEANFETAEGGYESSSSSSPIAHRITSDG
jgi:hypothetical protein